MSDDRDLEEVERLVEENRNAFARAKRLLSAMKQHSQRESDPGSDPTKPSTDTGGKAPEGSVVADIVPPLPGRKGWLDLAHLARVELDSEESSADLISSALSPSSGKGWRPKHGGGQTIRLIFAVPQSIRRIHLLFLEEEMERTQQFVLRWLPQGANDYREIVRQEYVFSPNGSTREVEEYQVDLRELLAVELRIVPDISGRMAFASLARWGLASSSAFPPDSKES